LNKDIAVLEFLYYWDRPINSGTLRKELNLKHSTLNSVIERLVKKGFVDWEKYSLISLTETGKDEAAHYSNHHFIVEKFLIDILDMKEEAAHNEALNLSNHISCELIDAICKKMGISRRKINTQFCTEREYLN
jgi:DtxR family Mn-dependent transcriptional regulator